MRDIKLSEDPNKLLKWNSSTPDLGEKFPSINQQIAEMPPLNYKLVAFDNGVFVADEVNDSSLSVPDDSRHWALPDAVELHGFSYHIGGSDRYYNSKTNEYGKINEDNYGLGFRWGVTDNSFVSAGCYENSAEQTSCYLSGGYETSLSVIPRVDTSIGVKTGLVSGYDGIMPEKYLIGDKYVPVIMPYFAIGSKDDVRVEVGYTYMGNEEDPPPNIENPELSIKPADGVITLSAVVPF